MISQNECLILRCMVTYFSAKFTKVNNFFDFLFTFLNNTALLLKGSVCSKGSKFLPLLTSLTKGGKMKMAELFALMCTHSP